MFEPAEIMNVFFSHFTFNAQMITKPFSSLKQAERVKAVI